MAEEFMVAVAAAACPADLTDALLAISTAMGFAYFALSHHVDIARVGARAIRLHNYPDQWADYYDRNALGVSDPVHRASHVTCYGFRWSNMANMIPLTARDRLILAQGEEQGIGDGFTIPANVPGEAGGSCSFANPAGVTIDESMLFLAQIVGQCAFEGARRLWAVRKRDEAPVVLTDRQRDCLLWTSRGKTDSEAGQILSISEETVARHISHANERYGVGKRSSAMVLALFDGTLTLPDLVIW
jgi:LuxR family quorum-sensing system transcriptional regulator CciR